MPCFELRNQLMIPALQTISSEIIQEMFSSVVKTTNEFRIRAWKLKIDKLKSVDLFEYKILTAILSAYVNKNDEAIEIVKSAKHYASSKEDLARVHEAIGNMLFHKGCYVEAMNSFWEAYDLTKDITYFHSFLSFSTNFAIYDPRLEQMKSINIDDREFLIEKIEASKIEQFCIEKSGLDIVLYREVITCAFTTFYTFCSGQLLRHPSYSDSNVSTILFNTGLDRNTVGLLNDRFSDALVDMLDEHDFEDLLKYPVIFTSEDYTAAVNREIYSG